MVDDFIYAQPLPVRSHNTPRSFQKRKRTVPDTEQERLVEHTTIANAQEYAAIVTPEERQQRRLAGQALTDDPPPYPFPHAPERKIQAATRQQDAVAKAVLDQSYSLRQQHLAAMTAMLHKCLESKDYNRASRALGLILRTEVNGRPVDLRHAGLWRIGAEILLRLPQSDRNSQISREGFGRAKAFYDKLALQHPWHRSWPDAINAQDFKLAMFGLWIFITCQESRQIQSVSSDDSFGHGDENVRLLEAKKWELSESEKIAREMDGLMGTIPFMDDLELIRLRGMVALWIADLSEFTEELESETGQDLHEEISLQHEKWVASVAEPPMEARPGNERAVTARNFAATMFARLNIREEDERSISSNASVTP